MTTESNDTRVIISDYGEGTPSVMFFRFQYFLYDSENCAYSMQEFYSTFY
jgi:hypothetical protein